MKIVKNTINEAFSDESDAIQDMGIGKKTQILKDLKALGFNENNLVIFNDYSFFSKAGRDREDIDFYKIQLKYFPPEKAKLLRDLRETKKDIKDIVKDAHDNGIKPDDILYIIRHMLTASWGNIRSQTAKHDMQAAEIYLKKISRTKTQVKEESENNVYVFIGYNGKVPVTIKGKQYYEDKFCAETVIKIDKYDIGQLASIGMMKVRAQQQYGDSRGAVYFITLPKDLLDEDRYEEIPEHLQDIFEKYKQRI